MSASLSDTDRARLLDLLDALRDDDAAGLDTQGEADLHRLVTNSDEAAALYTQHMQLVASLRWRFDAVKTQTPQSEPAAPASRSESAPPLPIYRKGCEPKSAISNCTSWTSGYQFSIFNFQFQLLAAALLAACGLATYVALFSADPQSPDDQPRREIPVATLIEATGSRVVYEDSVAHEGGEYAAGTYAIDSGSAQFLLRSRVTVNLRGKTRLVMHNPRHVTLSRGEADFKVPKDATGFTVHLPEGGQLVDLGTAFRVRVDDAGRPEVRVTEGTVAWTPAGEPDASILLSAGQVAHIVDGQIVATDAPTFIAYHDIGPDASDRVTTHRDHEEVVELIDYATGSPTAIRLAIDGDVGLVNQTGVTSAPKHGTPADDLFGPSGIDLDVGLMVAEDHRNDNQPIRLKLTGLQPELRYDLAMYGNRSAAPFEPVRYTLLGDESATNASTHGVVESLVTEFDTRDNADAGHVIRWTDIAAGSDGTIEIEIRTTLHGRKNVAYLNAIRLAAADAPDEPKETKPSTPDVPAIRSSDSEPADR